MESPKWDDKEFYFDVKLQVFRYNLIVPFGRQMFGLNWDKEVDKLKKKGQGGGQIDEEHSMEYFCCIKMACN